VRPSAELQRTLHTLKGGARMAGIIAMAISVHELETLVIQIDNGTVAVNDRAHHVMQSSLDELAHMRDMVSGGKLPHHGHGAHRADSGFKRPERSQRGTLGRKQLRRRRNPLLRR